MSYSAVVTINPGFANQISAVREFNRFYTARLGLLRKRHLDGEFSLTEARILYEIGSRPDLTARALCATLDLDAGYMSRLLGSLSRRKLIRRTTSEQDGREKRLSLTGTGVRSVAALDQKSEDHIARILNTIDEGDRRALVESLDRARRLLTLRPESEVTISRLTHASDEAIEILNEYYEAVHVVQRDKPSGLNRLLSDSESAMWLAKLAEEVVGCVVLRNLPSIPRAAECKRLYVRPRARGKHVARILLDTMEDHARRLNFEWIYLDTYDDLKPAIALYQQRGYEKCDRYNDNPQATLFMRKRLSREHS